MTVTIFFTPFHRFYPDIFCIHYTLNFFPQLGQTQKCSEEICLPLPQAPHSIPIGPNSNAPQQPLPAEKSFPVVVVSVIIWQFSFPHFGHFISLPLFLLCLD